MARIIFYNDISSLATLTSTTQNPAYIRENVQDTSPKNQFWGTGSSGERIIFDYGLARPIQGMTWHKSNLASGDSATFEGGTTSATTDVFDSLTEDIQGKSNILAWSYQHYAFDAATFAVSVLKMGKIGIWENAYPMPKTWDWGRNAGGYGDGDLNVFTENHGDGGQESAELQYTKQLFTNLNIPNMSNAQNTIMRAILKTPFIALYDDIQDKVFYGRLLCDAQNMRRINSKYSDMISLSFREAL